jgi:Phage capsid scaffolding protein (GPO) serine peptidase.
MKTKPFLLATAGSTVDGRTIDDKMIEQMASSYNPKTYGARLNIEHIRGISGDGPFRAYGDVLELSTSMVEVDFNGKKENRLGLFGVFDVTPDAKKLNEADQKVYPSIEIEPNFAGKGFAYLMGCALTDSPASIATQRLQFNRSLPGVLTVSAETAEALEFPDETGGETGAGFLAGLSGVLDRFAAKFSPALAKQDPVAAVDPAQVQTFDFSQMRPLFEEMGTSFSKAIIDLRKEFRADSDALAVKLQQLEATQEKTPAHDYRARPRSDGGATNYADVF